MPDTSRKQPLRRASRGRRFPLLSSADQRTLLGCLDELYAAPIRLDAFPSHVISVLGKAIRADNFAYTESHRNGLFRGMMLHFPPGFIEYLTRYAQIRNDYLYHRYDLTICGGEGRILSDYVPFRLYSQTEMYADVMRNIDARRALGLMNSACNGQTVFNFAALRSGGTDFTARDAQITTFLRPHFERLHEIARLRSLQSGGAAPPEDLLSLRLTHREAEILYWVAEGKSNADVAALLGMRLQTIKNHLYNIYQKLGVENRQAAILRALRVSRSHFPVPSTVTAAVP